MTQETGGFRAETGRDVGFAEREVSPSLGWRGGATLGGVRSSWGGREDIGRGVMVGGRQENGDPKRGCT